MLSDSHKDTPLIWIEPQLDQLLLRSLFLVLLQLGFRLEGEPVLHEVQQGPVYVCWKRGRQSAGRTSQRRPMNEKERKARTTIGG